MANQYPELDEYQVLICPTIEDRILWFANYIQEHEYLEDDYDGPIDELIEDCIEICNIHNTIEEIYKKRIDNYSNEEMKKKLEQEEEKYLDMLFIRQEKLKEKLEREDRKKMFYNFFQSDEYIDKTSYATAKAMGYDEESCLTFRIYLEDLY